MSRLLFCDATVIMMEVHTHQYTANECKNTTGNIPVLKAAISCNDLAIDEYRGGKDEDERQQANSGL